MQLYAPLYHVYIYMFAKLPLAQKVECPDPRLMNALPNSMNWVTKTMSTMAKMSNAMATSIISGVFLYPMSPKFTQLPC